jgi:hypothetical protein
VLQPKAWKSYQHREGHEPLCFVSIGIFDDELPGNTQVCPPWVMSEQQAAEVIGSEVLGWIDDQPNTVATLHPLKVTVL